MNTIAKLHAAFLKHELSPVEVTKEYIERIERYNKQLNAFVSVDQELALSQAAFAEARFMRGEKTTPLTGIPVGLKDVIYTKDYVTTAGCGAFADFHSGYDAAVVDRLISQGSVILGKTNLHQLCFGITGDRSFFGPPRNPYDIHRVTGGSSGGSAAGVSADLCTVALGTDTGGSCRIPAAFCGVVGIKPTFGLISRYGVYPYSHTLDCMGMLSKTVQDSILTLNALVGYDARDPGSVAREDLLDPAIVQLGMEGMCAGVPINWERLIIDEEIKEAFYKVLRLMEARNVKISYLDIPDLLPWKKARRCVQMHEAYEVNRVLIEQKREFLDEEIIKRFESFTYDADEYNASYQMLAKSRGFFEDIAGNADFVMIPTSPVQPTEINQRSFYVGDTEYGCIEQMTKFMWPCNMTGFPAMSVPIGLSSNSLPIGLQIMGKAFSETIIYRVAAEVEKEFGVLPPDERAWEEH